MESKPEVSVIVPVLNAEDSIESFLVALVAQSVDLQNLEIIIIDNGSKDSTIEIAEKFPIKLLVERNIKGPYAARNVGLREARGQYIAFTDVNKIPEKNWIKNGIDQLNKLKADMLGGDIRFHLDSGATASEVYDAITFNNNRRFIYEEKAAATGNLFITSYLVKKIGLFPEDFRSGMDIWWTRKAVRNGFKLVFSDSVTVYCKPRKFSDVIKKSFRVGKTHPYNQAQNGVSFSQILWMSLKTFYPPRLSKVKIAILEIGHKIPVWRVWMVAWISKIFMGIGRITGLTYLK